MARTSRMDVLASPLSHIYMFMLTLERHTPGHVTKSIKMKRVVWNVAAALLFRPFITPVFRKWRLLLLRLFGAQVEWDANVYASVKIWAPWMLQMGHRACLGPEVICYNQDWVVLEDEAIVSQYSYLCTAGHDVNMMNTADKSLITAPIILKSKSWIGARPFIGMGVEIGEGAVVGATASVYKSVEPWSVVGGNPCNIIKMRKLININSGGVIFRDLSHESHAAVVLFNKEWRAVA